MISRRHFISLAGAGGLSLAFRNKSIGAINDWYHHSLPEAKIEIDFTNPEGSIDKAIYGQFIEHLGRAVNGGIFEEGSTLSDKKGIRLDVLEKIQRMQPTILRYPGGTFSKIYHWMDGVGPINERHARPNLIWGGVDNNHFGTDEAVDYARMINAEPYFAVNMATGTAEEAGNWVEYSNGDRDTYYANLRRKNGHVDPFKIKYWGLGNEEAATPDIGRLQNVHEFVKEAWMYTKEMKLQDHSIKLILSGDNNEWNEYLLKEMGDVCDYISLHCYVSTEKNKPVSLFPKVDGLEKNILVMKQKIQNLTTAKVTNFAKWYRFPPRQNPVKIAIDELGIWEPGGNGAYELEDYYNWNHALGTATFYNIMQRQASVVGLATWAQTVNVLAPIMT
ncbi:MAG TPA: alpha-L-arabinofuranosidase C-terminal domain-containing protein, partial [Puia sp.]|nr:alpha-L-arabinofuranosidase C-terminal domain-containing protein [Puia sp.]